MAEPVEVTIEDRIATVTLNRPDVYNAFDRALVSFFARQMTELAADDAVSAVIVTGAGKAFCAGGNLKAIRDSPEGAKSTLHQLAAQFHAGVLEMRRMPKPVIAAVNGPAAGGGFSLALAADFRVMAQSAYLKCAYLAAGLTLDGGGTWILPRLVGLQRAMEITLFDQAISAEKAVELGLATKAVEDGRVVEEARAMAQDLMRLSRHSYAWTKRLLFESMHTSLETQLEREREGIAACGAHPDGQEGMAAFAEKRKPIFNQ